MTGSIRLQVLREVRVPEQGRKEEWSMGRRKQSTMRKQQGQIKDCSSSRMKEVIGSLWLEAAFIWLMNMFSSRFSVWLYPNRIDMLEVLILSLFYHLLSLATMWLLALFALNCQHPLCPCKALQQTSWTMIQHSCAWGRGRGGSVSCFLLSSQDICCYHFGSTDFP